MAPKLLLLLDGIEVAMRGEVVREEGIEKVSCASKDSSGGLISC